MSQYKSFFRKPFRTKFKSVNLGQNELLEESIRKSKFEMPSDVCVFNPNSYLNLKIVNETDVAYLDEAYQQTQPFSKFKDFVIRQYNLISHDFSEQRIELQPYDFDNAESIAGNVMLYAVLPDDQQKAQVFIDKISKIALRFGYSYVAHDIDDMYASGLYEVQIQFEATYFPGNVKTGDILWHITTKNIANKVVNQKKGLSPRSDSQRGFNYSPRVYCFKVLDKDLMRKYAEHSWKSNKKFVFNDNDERKLIKDNWIELVKKEYGSLFDTREFAILKINTNKLNCRFYRDNTFEYNDQFVVVYAESNIPASAIEISEIIQV